MVLLSRPSFQAEDSYGIVGGNFPALELMAMYTAAAMHDYDHPGRTNAFLVTTFAENAILYNDRSVLESHHAAAAWKLFLSDRRYNFLCHLEKAEFKRFRYIVIEAILATDLKRHFEFLADFNAKIEDETSCIDWNAEADRLLMLQMCIKLADINGPCKRRDLHVQWTERITDEFYEQGGEEAALGLPISPFMDRNNCQVAKLQESFINHLVAPLCTAYGNAGLLPGQWSESDVSDSESDVDISNGDSAKDDTTDADVTGGKEVKERCKVKKQGRKMWSPLSKHLKENHEHWVSRIKEEERSKDMSSHQDQPESDLKETEMETIVEETERSSVSSSVDNQKNEEVQDSGATSGDDGTFSPNKAEES
ncbi:PREDICTED: cGMP-inhibited 3',5'-cyclic phosphodiesterase B-like [Priapulus caudatus]|uniref:cGMP-inhibited 3',5'-cyclic phosphodiesterase B-like n=1 Tax=Priapulus caudatus TaxID=37621 RepID=A0ABM1E3V0_PRICU|nr:PREDICTED: cGMP-inhibited 3',5'-cyclic phosphodiesterase B-like [Priapulus caudatus]